MVQTLIGVVFLYSAKDWFLFTCALRGGGGGPGGEYIFRMRKRHRAVCSSLEFPILVTIKNNVIFRLGTGAVPISSEHESMAASTIVD